ncbi:peptidyl-prolyl cis-trans isomerase B (cyclophilin B) [Parabacteroides sp. PFB2-10]|uniref:peptidylprolyl isomerase n=1 Tax=Parabacteroides sp. PFB2-10 TaxID=1742405 RepID=UPI0024744F4F|nr:peptidylprolyl isomerase [Parabacteroides sp. PFB2-10]MDH6313282.1 peptidyl-prolyl cis-trans isomerase B (cyclophilin B) [Parabacteroides sp. PFB2-10]
MNKKYILLLILLAPCIFLQAQQKTVTIETNVGTMKGILYADVPNHVRAFTERANRGDFNGTLFTRVIKEFMIQGGAADSRNASPGVRVGSGDRSAEIMPEKSEGHFFKKGVIAAPRQPDNINPQKKSDMSQFFIVQGKVYTPEELRSLQQIANRSIRRKAMAEFYDPIKEDMEKWKTDDKVLYNQHVVEINHKVDSVIRATPGHLLFTDQQREAYTTVGGAHHLDGHYTIFGEITEGLDLIDRIANQPTDQYDRPNTDIRIIRVTVQ